MNTSQINPHPILYTFRRCPYAIRARMALAYSDITIEIKEIFLQNRPQELFDISPKGTVPVLCLNNSKIIDESLDIMQWSLTQNDPDSWIIPNLDIQLKLIKENDSEFKYWLDRYKYYDRYPEHDKNYYREKCGEYISKLNIMLKDSAYLYSNKISIADVAIFPFIRQCANVDTDWFTGTFPQTNNWLTLLIKSNLFLSIMHKYPEYQSGQKPLVVNFSTM